LGALDLHCKPRTTIKSQALVDFLAEWRENQVPIPASIPEYWTVYFDGSLKLGGGRAGVLFISPRGEQLKYVLQILFEVSNNEAEYEALLHSLRLAISLLVVQQVNKEWDINKETVDAYVAEIRKLENRFSRLEIHHVISDNNVAADVLSKLGSDRVEVPPGIIVHELHHHSISTSTPMEVESTPQETSREVMMIEVDWRATFIDYIKDQVLPLGIKKEDAEAIRITRRNKNYILVDDKLYK